MTTGKVMEGTYFVCDKCGREYTFSGSYLTVRAGEKYFDPRDEQTHTAPCDLCRDCSGQNTKFAPGVQAQLEKEIAEIDSATEALLMQK